MKPVAVYFRALVMSLLVFSCTVGGVAAEKPRVVILTDIAPADVEPDDKESMVRLLSHSDLFEIEAIITCSGWNCSGGAYPDEWRQHLFEIIDAYEKDLPNLMKRSGQTGFKSVDKEGGKQEIGYWQSADYLRSRVFQGSRHLGVAHLGADNNTPGSDFIINLVKERDSRPIWILIWGGGNTVAQSLWKLKNSEDEKTLALALEKLRLYTITDQDVDWGNRTKYELSSHKWMRETFGKSLFFIWDESAWLSQNSLGASDWDKYATLIQGKGHMGKIYPRNKYGVEGDTPSFLYVIPNGLNNPEQPSQVGWGGYFKMMQSDDKTTCCYNNSSHEIKSISGKYEKYFYDATFDNFAARMEWAETGEGNRNPVVVINGDRSLKAVDVKCRKGKSVTLDARQSYDPDGDKLSIKWWILPEAGDVNSDVALADNGDGTATITVAGNCNPGNIHIICEVTDDGKFCLKGYRRIILSVKQ